MKSSQATKRVLILALLFTLSLLSLAILVSASSAPVVAFDPNQNIATLNQMAIIADSGTESSVRSLVNTEFQRFSWAISSPSLSGEAQDRIVRSELSYHAQLQPPISDERIAYAVNRLAQRLNAPQFAYTSVSQIRKLRLALMASTPRLAGANTMTEVGGSLLSQSLSPSESAWIVLCLLHQKAFNSDFQIEPNMWDTFVAQKENAFLQNPQQTSQLTTANLASANYNQLENTIIPVLVSMSESERSELLNATLDDLGMAR